MAAFTATLKRRARRLYDDGHGCNAIARQLNVTPSTISTWAKDQGLPFDRRQTAMAVRAHTIDLRADALLAAQKLMVAAHDLLDSLDRPYERHELGGEFRDQWIRLDLDAPPVEVARNISVTAGIAIDKALKVSTALDEGADLPAVDAWLSHMTGAT